MFSLLKTGTQKVPSLGATIYYLCCCDSLCVSQGNKWPGSNSRCGPFSITCGGKAGALPTPAPPTLSLGRLNTSACLIGGVSERDSNRKRRRWPMETSQKTISGSCFPLPTDNREGPDFF